MNAVANDTSAPTYDAYPVDSSAILRLFIVGIVMGLLGWLLYLGIARYFIEPVFCQSATTFGVCQNGGTIAWVSAHVIVLAAAVAVLARFAVYRPLLVVLGVFAALWGAHTWLGAMTWYTGALWQAVLFGLAFAVFGWVARAANFVLSVVLLVLLVIVSRAVLALA